MQTHRTLSILVLIGLLSVSVASHAQQYDYLQNDDLDFGATQLPTITTGAMERGEWIAARLTNDTDETFVATEVQFLMARLPDEDYSRTFLCAGLATLGYQTASLTTVNFQLKVWIDDGSSIHAEFADAVFTYPPTEEEQVQATINAINSVPLGIDMSLAPGDSVRIAINFPTNDTNPCTGLLMQDATNDILLGFRNYIFGSKLCPEIPGIGSLCGEACGCEDTEIQWRNFNGTCSDTPVGVCGSGDFAIRLARVSGSTTPDTGTPDVATPDAGTPDATVDAGVDAPTPVTINRVVPSMGPTNQDTELDVFGAGFANGMSVRIGSTDLTGLVVDLTGTQVTGTLAAGLPVGTYDVIASVGTESYTYASGYMVTDAEYPAPIITDLTPTSAGAGESVDVTITGENFRDGATVLFGTASGRSVQVNSETSITVSSPSTLAGGAYDVKVENEDGLSDTLFEAFSVASLDTSTGSDDSGCACSVKAQPSSKWFLAALPIALVVVRRRRG